MPRNEKKNGKSSRVEKILGIHTRDEHGVSPWRIFKIMAEFVSGFEFLSRYEGKRAITFFGSSRSTLRDKDYREATKLAHRLSKAGYTIVSGGGSGIMEAANKGAYEAGGRSLGIGIKLPREQPTNPYVKESENFHYFFTRKVMLSFASEVYVFFPGGFGTLDELFEIITLVQTKKVGPVPIILVDRSFWAPLLRWVKEWLYGKRKAIDRVDMNIYRVVDNANEAFTLIRKMSSNRKARSLIHEARRA
ncbi:TIGR00730 family Rossman fold protein [Candidatus Parcubacteria bacterium]|nr:MAG: TIGR00730 family Rossman fold protein [Candidatus Parcubacteria bacterium]